MAPGRNEMVLSLALVVMMWHGAWAQSTCMNAAMSLAPCSNFLTGSLVGPSLSCCSQVNWVIQNQPECICSLMNGGGAALGIVASQTSSLALPGACSLASPSLDRCNGGTTGSAASPASAPVGSQLSGSTPSDSSRSNVTPQIIAPTTPSQTNTPSSAGGGSKTVPSTNNASFGATITKSPFSFAVPLLLAMSFNLRSFGF